MTGQTVCLCVCESVNYNLMGPDSLLMLCVCALSHRVHGGAGDGVNRPAIMANLLSSGVLEDANSSL